MQLLELISLSCIPLIYMTASVPVPYPFYKFGSEVQLQGRYCDTSTITLFAQDCFGYLWSF
jgi:hypothetical protein